MNEAVLLKLQRLVNMLIPFLVFLITILVGFILRKILFSRISSWAKKTQTKIDDIFILSLRLPFMIWCFIFGVYLALKLSKLPADLAQIVDKILFILGIISVTLFLANISSKLIKFYASKIESVLPITSLTQNITRIVIFIIGILVILNSLGISITPILATLGVGGLAIALSLQDTLSNLFAGFYIIASKQIRVGDYIKLDSNEEGYVTDINWRITKIRTLPNNVVLVPNDKLAKSIITNYYLPDKEMAVLVNLGVHYDSDLEKVEKITCEVAKEVMQEVEGGVFNFEPFIRYHTFGDFSINFTVILRAKEFVNQHLIKHEFIKRLHKRFKKEGIIIPYPIRAINYKQEK